MNEDYPSAVSLPNDYPKRTPRKVGHRCGTVVSNGKARNAAHIRVRRSKMEARKPEASEQITDSPNTIPDLLRAIERIGCRVIQIENLAWTIESSEASRGSCLLVGSYGRKQQKPSRYEGGGARMGRSKKASRRSRNGARSMGRSEPSHSSDGGSARMDNEVARSNQIASGCPSFEPSGQSKPIRPRMRQASHPRRNQSNLRYHSESRGGV